MFNEFQISDFYTMRNYLVTKKISDDRDHIIPYFFYSKHGYIPEHIFDTAKSLRANTLKTLSANIKSAFTNLKNKNIRYFKLKYKSKNKLDFNVISDDKTNCNISIINNKYYISISKLKNIKIKVNTKEKIPLEITSEIKIEKTKLGFNLVLPYTITKTYESNKTVNKTDLIVNYKKDMPKVCALDPGQRTFLTGFDSIGNIFNIGNNANKKILELKLKKDKIKSEYEKYKKIKKKKYKEYKKYKYYKYKYYTMENKIKNYIKELHHQSANYLTKEYDKIILPKYETQKMVKKGSKNFNKMILSLNHFNFKNILKNKCKKHNKTLIEVCEAYTSKTCSNCSKYKLNLGSSKIYNCEYCKRKFDRDENAAYNIYKHVILGELKIYNIY